LILRDNVKIKYQNHVAPLHWHHRKYDFIPPKQRHPRILPSTRLRSMCMEKYKVLGQSSGYCTMAMHRPQARLVKRFLARKQMPV
jgi:hypothetical protein